MNDFGQLDRQPDTLPSPENQDSSGVMTVLANRLRHSVAALAVLALAGCAPSNMDAESDAGSNTSDAYSEFDAFPEAQRLFRVAVSLLENSEGVHGINIYGSTDTPMVFDVVVKDSAGNVVAKAADTVSVNGPIFNTPVNLDNVLNDDTGDLVVRIIGTDQETGEIHEESVEFAFDDEGIPEIPK